MKKKLFFSFALFVALIMVVAWQFAAKELAELELQRDQAAVENVDSELS